MNPGMPVVTHFSPLNIHFWFDKSKVIWRNQAKIVKILYHFIIYYIFWMYLIIIKHFKERMLASLKISLKTSKEIVCKRTNIQIYPCYAYKDKVSLAFIWIMQLYYMFVWSLPHKLLINTWFGLPNCCHDMLIAMASWRLISHETQLLVHQFNQANI